MPTKDKHTADNQFGQLGDGSFNSRTSIPERIVASNVTAIAAGACYSLFLKNDGSVWGTGTNNLGQLGDGTYTTTNRPEQILAAYNQISIGLLSGAHTPKTAVVLEKQAVITPRRSDRAGRER